MDPKLNLEYKITKDEWISGYDLYYKLFKRTSTYTKAAIFIVPLALFIQQVVIDPSYATGWICIAACVMMIVGILFSHRLDRKNTANALDAIADDVYILDLYDDRLTVKTIINEKEENLERDENGEVIPLPEIPESVCEFSERSLKVYETNDIIGLFSRKGSFFIPKSAFDDESFKTFKMALIAVLGERYRVKN